MYRPAHFVEDRIEVLHALMAAHRLAAVVRDGPGGLEADHLPLLLDVARGPQGTLMGHVARGNPLWQVAHERSVLVLFQGPHAYLSPSWYPGKALHGRVVPTWNYAVVHVRGRLRAIENRAWLAAHLERMTDENENGFAAPWKVGDAPADFIDTLLGAIVGIEIDIASITGKWKVSQNRSEADRLGAAAGLLERGLPGAPEIAALTADHGENRS